MAVKMVKYVYDLLSGRQTQIILDPYATSIEANNNKTAAITI
jgi:hypothetical protein